MSGLRDELEELLAAVGRGEVAPEQALVRIQELPYRDLGFARVDLHREVRQGAPEAILAEGKSVAEVVAIFKAMVEGRAGSVLATRADAAVRAAVTMAAVLQLLGCTLHARGAQHRGPCPLHGSTSGTSRCFSAHLNEHIFHCFKCGPSGNALDLWALATRQTPYDAAIDLCQRLHLPLPTLPTSRNREEETVPPQPQTCTMPTPQS